MTTTFGRIMNQVTGVLFVIGAFLLWEASVWIFGISSNVLPPPSSILSEVTSRLGFYLDNATVTLQAIAYGLALALVVSCILAVIIAETPMLGKAVYPLLIASQAVPVIAVAPVLVMWFGYGMFPKALVVTMICFFPLTINISRGLLEFDDDALRMVRALGAKRWWILVRFRIPNALPYAFAGLKIAVVLATIGAVVAEWVGSLKGLGYLILSASEQLSVNLTFGAIAVTCVLGLILYGIVLLIERWAMPWR